MRKRLLLVFLLLLILGAVVVLAWTFAGLPPVRYVLRYGLAPGCEPTGQTKEFEGVEFVEIGPGVFRMGSDHLAEGGDWLGRVCEPLGLPWGERAEPSDEMPVHWVEFERGFWIARTEVTNAQYERFDPEHERIRAFPGDDHPVVEVSWEDAKAYCAWLSKRSGLAVRLPSESEWECACRAGRDDEYAFGDDEAALPEYAWFGQDLESGARPVATKRANRWGLHDLHGNVWEWCEDTWHESYEGAPTDGSAWVTGGSPDRVRRGGGWAYSAERCRSACRNWWLPGYRGTNLGFRPAFSPSNPRAIGP